MFPFNYPGPRRVFLPQPAERIEPEDRPMPYEKPYGANSFLEQVNIVLREERAFLIEVGKL